MKYVHLIWNRYSFCELAEITVQYLYNDILFFSMFHEKGDFEDHFQRKVTKRDLGDLKVENVISWSPCFPDRDQLR